MVHDNKDNDIMSVSTVNLLRLESFSELNVGDLL